MDTLAHQLDVAIVNKITQYFQPLYLNFIWQSTTSAISSELSQMTT